MHRGVKHSICFSKKGDTNRVDERDIGGDGRRCEAESEDDCALVSALDRHDHGEERDDDGRHEQQQVGDLADQLVFSRGQVIDLPREAGRGECAGAD